MRLFVGIPLNPKTSAELESVHTRLAPKLDGWRWTQPESWHITLQFLGAADQQTCDQLIAQLSSIRSPTVPIQLGNLDFFARVGVFFAEVVLSPQLIALQQKVVHATAPCGFAAESRPYHPHITLARIKGAQRSRDLRSLRSKLPQQPAFTRFVATEFLLYESFLEPAGARYEMRARFAL
jgi:RNA 2',3'-cyclic 3'-phosphodiesterase